MKLVTYTNHQLDWVWLSCLKEMQDNTIIRTITCIHEANTRWMLHYADH